MTRKTTLRALLMSVLSLVLCFSMLIGSTFAWFTDTASTGVNTIASGNLDLVLEYWDGTNWTEVKDTTKLFKDGALWEPGYTEVAYIRVRNNGSLAFKYQLAVNAANEEKGTNVNGQEFALSQYIQFGVVESATEISQYATREDAWAAVEGKTTVLNTYNSEGVLFPKNDETEAGVAYLALVVYMPTTTGNDANHKTGTEAPSIDLGVTVTATQTPHENDSFGNDYDNILGENERRATNDAELAAILNGDLTGVDTIYLNGSFGATTLPVGTNGVSLVGQNGATMASLNINGAKNVVISGLTFDAAKAVRTHVNKVNGAETAYTASVYDDRTVANNNAMSASENVTIKNCTFSGTATADADGGYTAINIDDNGAGTRANGITIEGCTFNCNAFSYVYIQSIHENSAVVIKGNTFGGEGYSTTWTAVAVQQLNSTHVQITNNTFNSFNADKGAVVVSTKSSAPVATATITGNTFNGTINDGKCVICIRRCNSTGHTISGNTYNIANRTLTDSSTEVRTDNEDPSTAVAIWYRQTQS